MYCLLVAAAAAAAVVMKEVSVRRVSPALAAVEREVVSPEPVGVAGEGSVRVNDPLIPSPEATEPVGETEPELADDYEADTTIRYFGGRPVRPVRQIMMTVTGYSPDARSCGDSADGITASLHDVETNAFKLVAADTRVLPLGTMVSVPGYDQGMVVPVLDRGGKIKGARLDVLFPTHEQAMKWGVRKIPVTVWQYADGKPAPSWRRVRDSKN